MKELLAVLLLWCAPGLASAQLLTEGSTQGTVAIASSTVGVLLASNIRNECKIYNPSATVGVFIVSVDRGANCATAVTAPGVGIYLPPKNTTGLRPDEDRFGGDYCVILETGSTSISLGKNCI